jgi:proton-translocating NADH-quinone oxidoreductase chain M
MFYIKNLLNYILLSPLIGIFMLSLVPKSHEKLIKLIALNFSYLPFIGCLLLWGCFKDSVSTFQFVNGLLWFPVLNFNLIIGIDGISLLFLLLTTVLIPICILVSWDNKSNIKFYLAAFLMLEFFLIGVFCILDLLIFYIFFESILIPMFLLIGIWGSRERKVLATYYFFLYTLFGSVFMLISIVYIYYQVGTTDYEILLTFSFTDSEQKLLWISFFIAFAAKIPMMPFHLWLPEAHVEAPTAGSVLLAGVLLKLGSYGFIRFSLPLFPKACFYFVPFVHTLCIVGVIYSSFTALRQTDFKRIVAYTSIAHMNLVVLGIFSLNSIGVSGAVLQSLSHGFVASALFLIIGVVYDRHHTRLVKYYGGFVHIMPIYVSIFLFFTLANISFPGTSNFIGEFLILAGSFQINSSTTFLGASGMILCGCYSLWLFNRISFGNLKNQYNIRFFDLTQRELLNFFPLILGTLIIGLFPDVVLDPINISVNNIIEHIYF